eukprot:scaffold73346_cov37-Prasinocladus_malaysianus.AAC.1
MPTSNGASLPLGDSKFDVVISGAGPVGMLAALELVRHGVAPEKVLLLDRQTQPARYAKASTLWP